MKAKLIVRGGKLDGREIPVRTPQFLIGRDETCNLRPASNMVSKLHCALVAADEVLWLRDLKSTNGTFLNGAKIAERALLKSGDQIRVGPLLLEIQIEPSAEAQRASAAKSKRPTTKESLDEDVCDWLSEEEVPPPEGAELSETPTIVDLAATTETVAQMTNLSQAPPKPPSAPKRSPSKPASNDTSAAASNILQNYFVRRRNSG
jgi:predicted component of type VI protein secretion system